jgi:hypothetical protein
VSHKQTISEDIESESDLSEDININENQGYKIKLPPHMRHPCHILNLIATTDVHKIENALFARTFENHANLRNFSPNSAFDSPLIPLHHY